MTEWRKVRKRTVVVEAWGPWDGTAESALALQSRVRQRISYADAENHFPGVQTETPVLLVETLEGWMQGSPGDYIIRGVKGELYPCKPDVFAETYEEIVTQTTRLEPDGETVTVEMSAADEERIRNVVWPRDEADERVRCKLCGAPMREVAPLAWECSDVECKGTFAGPAD